MKLEKPLGQMTADELEEVGYKMLREAKDFYGTWEKVREVIEILEDSDNDAAFERSQNQQ